MSLESEKPVAIVTGGGTGIGRETALLLARAGWHLVLAARRGDLLEEVAEIADDLGAAGIMLRFTDVGIEEDAETLIDTVHEAFGRIDVLINNAGTAPLVPLGDMDRKVIDRVFAVNVVGPGIMTNRIWPIMKAQKRGRIINVSSLAAKDPFPGFFAYAAAKAGVNSYVRSIAGEGAAFGIKGFAVAPGAVDTPMLRSVFSPEQLPSSACLQPTEVAELIADCAMGRRDEDNGKVIWISKDEGITV